jgi:hypothetical protein
VVLLVLASELERIIVTALIGSTPNAEVASTREVVLQVLPTPADECKASLRNSLSKDPLFALAADAVNEEVVFEGVERLADDEVYQTETQREQARD